MKRLLHNIGLLATAQGNSARGGSAQGEISYRKDAWVLIDGGRISAVGTGTAPAAEEKIDVGGRLVTAGLIDAHTHLIFGGWRQHELGQKLRGVPYLDILAAGGGILDTVRQTRAATVEALAEKALPVLSEMLRFGTTTVEAKSGYGLQTEAELKQLRAVEMLRNMQPVETVSTFMGGHALPEEYRNDREGYLRLLCEEMIPRVAREHLAEFCDVFCEQGVFSAEESERILRAGAKHGLLPKLHADEIHAIGGSELAGRLSAVSAEHLIVCPPTGIESMAAGGTVACLLPATSLYLNAEFAPARQMIEAGVPVAMATDFNPGSCPCGNMQLVINLGCLKYRLTPEEVLTAVTLNAAAALNRADRLGSVECGKQADLVIWDAPDWDFVCYRMGGNSVKNVIKNGKTVV